MNGRRSDSSLYDYGLATYEAADTFDQTHAEGFVRLWGLGVQTWAARQGGDVTAARQGGDVTAARQGGDVTAARQGGE